MSEESATTQADRQHRNFQETIARLAPWFQNIHLPNGLQTAPNHWLGDFPMFKWKDIAPSIPADLNGWTALDIGCNAGFYSIELAKRGARVTAIDHDPHYLRQARWVADQFKLQDRITFKEAEVYALAELDQSFDLVLFLGVLYHLRYPLLALDIVSDRVKRLLVLQTLMMPGNEVADVPADLHFHDRARMQEAGFPKMAFIEHRLAGDPTNWWVANHACMQAMIRSANLKLLSRPAEETYICEPAPGWRAMNRLIPTIRTEAPR